MILASPQLSLRETLTMQNRRQFLAYSAALSIASMSSLGAVSFAQDAEWASKMFEKKSHDFGVVARGAATQYRLKLKNIYEQEVHIAEVRTTCGCTAGKPSQETLKSLEEAYVTITMDTVKFKQKKDSNVIVVFDRPLSTQVTIPITAYIRQDVVVDPGSVQFGSVYREDKNEQTVKIQYAGRDDWKVKEIKTNSDHISAKVVETARGNGRVDYDLIVGVSNAMPVGALRQYISLVTDDQSNPIVPVLVEGDIKADIFVDPSLVSLGTMQPGQSKTVQVVVKGRKPFEVESVTCEKAQEVFQVRLPKNAAPVQVIPLTVTAPDKAGTLDEELSIAIPGRADAVKFRAYAKIASRE